MQDKQPVAGPKHIITHGYVVKQPVKFEIAINYMSVSGMKRR